MLGPIIISPCLPNYLSKIASRGVSQRASGFFLLRISELSSNEHSDNPESIVGNDRELTSFYFRIELADRFESDLTHARFTRVESFPRIRVWNVNLAKSATRTGLRLNNSRFVSVEILLGLLVFPEDSQRGESIAI